MHIVEAEESIRHFKYICEQISKGEVEEGSQEYVELLLEIKGGNNIGNGHVWEVLTNKTLSDCVRTCAYSYMMIMRDEIFPGPGIQKPLSQDEKYGQQLNESPAYHYFKSVLYGDGHSTEQYRIALDSALLAADSINTNPETNWNVAKVILEFVARTDDIEYIYEGRHISGEELIDLAEKYLIRSIDENLDVPKYPELLARIHLVRDEFEKAKEWASSALDAAAANDEHTQPYQQLLWRIEEAEAEFQFRERIKDAQSTADEIQAEYEQALENVESLEERQSQLSEEIGSMVDEYETKLEETAEQFRSQILQFLGFFAAVIAIIIATTQAAINLPFPQSAALVLILIGGMLIVFAGFNSMIVPISKDGGNIVSSNTRAIITGVILLLLGILLGFIDPLVSTVSDMLSRTMLPLLFINVDGRPKPIR